MTSNIVVSACYSYHVNQTAVWAFPGPDSILSCRCVDQIYSTQNHYGSAHPLDDGHADRSVVPVQVALYHFGEGTIQHNERAVADPVHKEKQEAVQKANARKGERRIRAMQAKVQGQRTIPKTSPGMKAGHRPFFLTPRLEGPDQALG